MPRRFAAGVLMLLLGGCGHLGVSGPESRVSAVDPWDAVRALRVGQIIDVDLCSGRRVVGEVVAVTDDRLVVRATRDLSVARTDVRVVAVPAGRETTMRARRGLIVGAAAGALLNAFTTGGHPVWVLMGAAGGGVLGAVFGALDGVSTVRRAVIYQVTSPTTPAAAPCDLPPASEGLVGAVARSPRA